ncbi:beta-lactamase family protein [Solihabitans fulvus]|uniref:Beta-lactamase family protein n=1 Tax=Solihabitans fulvus TaxID=1892852 RepID=A0A5B2WV50_9PSEU|nr:serine hydrolase domain-containing protein [Solihabitans fulvus]KAA2255445.1 beta-lactamase family protein [Solihabitans fulvus]
MADIQGTCAEEFSAVRDALAASLDNKDVGASASVYVDGEMVVDIWGGYADAARTTPWERDTITNVWSTTKTMVALCALILADRGDLDLDAPVARYWPEFAAAGKDGVLVRHVLSHTAGLPDWDGPVAVEDLYDSPSVTARLAAQAPFWEPGTEAGYHSLTFGFLVGELVRRVTGRSLGTFFAEDVAGPMGADFHIGLAAEHDHRVAPVIAPPVSTSVDRIVRESGDARNGPIPPGVGNSVAWRRAEIPAASGFGNARSVAAVQSVLANGGTARGVRLLSAAGCQRVREEQFHGKDRIFGVPMRYGMGYALNGNSCSWGGMGGSVVVVDLDAHMAVSYVMNQMLDEGGLSDERGVGIVLAAYAGLS